MNNQPTYNWDKLFGDWEVKKLFNSTPYLSKNGMTVPPPLLLSPMPKEFRWIDDLPKDVRDSLTVYVNDRWEQLQHERKKNKETAALAVLQAAGVVGSERDTQK